jgi:hypothetical protein
MKQISFVLLVLALGVNSAVILRFANFSDCHWTKYENAHQNLGHMVHWLNDNENSGGKSLDYTFVVGDISNDLSNTRMSEWNELKDTLDKLTMPYYCVQGNHDDGLNATEWENLWGYPPRHDFSVGDFAFIIENTGDYQCPTDNGAWLDGRLDFYSDKSYVFVFMHINPVSLGGYSINCPGLKAAIEGHSNIAGVYHGHDHAKDDYELLNGQYYFWDAFSWGLDGQRWFSPGYVSGYRITEVNSDGTITSYQNNNEGYDSAVVVNTLTYNFGPVVRTLDRGGDRGLGVDVAPNPFNTRLDILVRRPSHGMRLDWKFLILLAKRWQISSYERRALPGTHKTTRPGYTW